MKTDIKQLTRILINAVEGKTSAQMKSIIKDFVEFLQDKKILSEWREIEKLINIIWKEKYGASSIKILSAYPLTENIQKSINEIAPGADVSQMVDKQILGGAVIRIDDTRIDGSIVGKLQSLKAQLSK